MARKIIVYILFVSFHSSIAFAAQLSSFIHAKEIATELFKSNSKTLYCGCHFDHKKTVDLKSCHMLSARHQKRAHRLEWEHIMPAENFGRHFKCWREKLCKNKKGKHFGGRKCCQRIDKRFQKTEGELYNIWPSVGLVNQARSNYRFSTLPKKQGFYSCDIEIDKSLRKVDPPNRAKGIVARAHLFMAEHYNIRLSPSQRKLFFGEQAQGQWPKKKM